MPIEDGYVSSITPATMITKLEGLCGCSTLDPADEDFVLDMVDMRDTGIVTRLTDAQIRRLRALHDRHFAG